MFKKTFLITIFSISAFFNVSYAGYVDRIKSSLSFVTICALVSFNLTLASAEPLLMLPAPDAKGACPARFHCDNYRCVQVLKKPQASASVVHSSEDSYCRKDADGSYNPGPKGYVFKK